MCWVQTLLFLGDASAQEGVSNRTVSAQPLQRLHAFVSRLTHRRQTRIPSLQQRFLTYRALIEAGQKALHRQSTYPRMLSQKREFSPFMAGEM